MSVKRDTEPDEGVEMKYESIQVSVNGFAHKKAECLENCGEIELPVTLTCTKPTEVRYTCVDITAKGVLHYQRVEGALTFEAGSHATLTLPAIYARC